MDLINENEIAAGHWQARRRALKEVLDAIPFTKTQRENIDHNLNELENLFKQENTKTTRCTKPVEGGAALCGVKLDCHLHDWRSGKPEIDAVVNRIVRGAFPQDLGTPTSEFEGLVYAEIEKIVRQG